MSHPPTTHGAIEAGAHWLTHAAAMVLGALLILVALTFGVTIVGLPVAAVLAVVGLLAFGWGVVPSFRSWREQP
jgi:hypothetical protein